MQPAKPTHFGFKTIPEDQKASLVRGVFDSVASRYDLMNDLMSGGLHRLWKNEMVAWLNPCADMKMLDVAGGTGDVAFRILNSLPTPPQAGGGRNHIPPVYGGDKGGEAWITICDINEHMLIEGRNRAIDRNFLPTTSNRQPATLSWLCADAEALPLPDNAFDAYTIAFGIRNVTHIDKALAEAFRVLKPGGRFLCLEFSQPAQAFLQKIYDAYSFHVIPKIGRWVTGSGEPYQYLVESIRQFPDQETFASMIRAAGLGNVQYRNMTQGVVAMHSARRL